MKSSLLIKYLLLFFLLTGISTCTVGQWKNNVFDSTFKKALYKGSLDISKYHISGLFFLKKISTNDYRIVFSNEMGMNFFDLEIKGSEFLVHSCFPSLNRSALLKIIENDFRMLIFSDTTVFSMKKGRSKDPELLVYGVKSLKGAFRYTIDKDSGRIRRIQTSHSVFGRTDLRLYGEENRQPTKVHIFNPTIHLHFHMTYVAT
jgi:hypothetical protein